MFNILFSQVSNLAIQNISWKYYLVFICLNAVDFVIITLFFPETKGPSPLEGTLCYIDIAFGFQGNR